MAGAWARVAQRVDLAQRGAVAGLLERRVLVVGGVDQVGRGRRGVGGQAAGGQLVGHQLTHLAMRHAVGRLEARRR